MLVRPNLFYGIAYALCVLVLYACLDLIYISPAEADLVAANSTQSLLDEAINLAHQGRYDEAMEIYDRLLELDPNDLAALNNKGLVLRDLGRYDEAMEIYDRLLELDPNNINGLYNKGGLLTVLGRHDEAMKYLDTVLALNSTDIDTLNIKGLILTDLGRYDEAMEYLNKTLDINSSNIDALYLKGIDLYGIERYDEAIKYMDMLLAMNSSDIDALNAKGVILYELGRNDEAMDYINEALTVNSTDSLALANKALILADMNKSKEASTILSEAIRSNPFDPFLQSSMGYVQYKLGNYEKAGFRYMKALEEDPILRQHLTKKELSVLDSLVNQFQQNMSSKSRFVVFEENGVSMRYPLSWEKEDNRTQYTIAKFSAPSSSKSSPAKVVMSKLRLPSTENSDKQGNYNAYSQAQLTYIKNHYNITEINSTRISNSSAYEVGFNNGNQVSSMIWTYKDNYIYSIIFSANASTYESYLPNFHNMVNSFTVLSSAKSDFPGFFNSLLQESVNKTTARNSSNMTYLN